MTRRGQGRPGGSRRGRPTGLSSSVVLARLGNFAYPATVALVTVLSFLPTLDNGFVEWDDDFNLKLNEGYRGLGWAQLKWMFADFHFGHYSPLAWLTYALDYLLWGLDPLGYHLTSLVLHTASAVAFYLVALRLLRAALPAAAAYPRRLQLSASIAALLFSIHPLRVEAVAWATARLDVLCGFVYLLAVLVYLRREQDSPAGTPIRRRRYWTCLGLFVLALLSKSMAVTLPAALLLLDAYPLRRFPLTRAGLRSEAARVALLEKLPFFAVSVAAGVVAVRATLAENILTADTALRPADRAGIALYGLGFYLFKLVWPIGIANLYPLQIPFDPFSAPVLLCAAAVAALAGFGAWRWRRSPALLMVLAAYVVVLLPVSGIFHKGPQIAANRYTYLPMLAWAVLLGALLLRAWLARPLAARPRLRVALLGVLPCVLVITLGALTFRQVRIWHDSASLWANAVHHAPSARAHHGLGRELMKRGKVAEAVPHLRASIDLQPEGRWGHEYLGGHYFLGDALERLGQLPEATDEYRRAAHKSPQNAHYRNRLGVALLKQDRIDEAVSELRRAVALKGDFAEARKNLGAALSRQGSDVEAIEQLEEALRLSPGLSEAHEGLGLALMRQGDLFRASRELRAALARSRHPAEVHNNLGVALARQGDSEGAAREFRKALELRPGYPAAQRNLDAALSGREGRLSPPEASRPRPLIRRSRHGNPRREREEERTHPVASLTL